MHVCSVRLPSKWVRWGNELMNDVEVERLRRRLSRATPSGGEAWVRRTAERLFSSSSN